VDDDPAAWDFLPASYDTVAAEYEARFGDELRDKPLDRELLEAFAMAVGDPLVDVGSGPGQVGAFLRHWDRRVIGIDLSPEMARLAAARLDAALVADMRALPLGTDSVGGLLAFYAVIHLGRAELGSVLREFHRVLRPGGRVLFSAHEGTDVVELDAFLGEPVRFAATLFQLDELVEASRNTGLEVTVAERRAPYASEGQTTRLYVEARKPDGATSGSQSPRG
jgi:SAM-dependent methyltransferase